MSLRRAAQALAPRGEAKQSHGIAEPVPSAATNLSFYDVRPLYLSVVKKRLRVCFGFASQPLSLLAMTTFL